MSFHQREIIHIKERDLDHYEWYNNISYILCKKEVIRTKFINIRICKDQWPIRLQDDRFTINYQSIYFMMFYHIYI